ncbi:Glu-tRNA(Gln) amidotransferase, subunit A [Campylobacter blaseri]|uniref:Glutamyl-tRNA(Gln) amidotransferase subunit A n=1 Tax=Campylobacter blaseri TaxID=2042961 RepID=A0A2P8R0J1_9BACT|nr:Asp-tRNA(Asn)/Glu-tRNA(Gln) amidotransferase subunit GatA [Campylobacter blaseri]PSM52009.1 Asp-tRNA(Asn)/Glu-tRNA(Gln) amidotransferase GatCAB subunit A [Campylobacter blaseri]PSM53794.1 Asp-tRNA(Asn)/Glu-tRNA(Gln) amidotransferase GatCAB subunit A [Campylobacter blaseri]QKF85654.1 Glu-tRNA(Gln) amidotransferase, subunit A [Campylobacter blaseri]
MISLKEALKLPADEINKLRKELEVKIKEDKELGAYVEQLTNGDISISGEGIPIAIKDNIQVKNWSVTSCSKILQGYVAPYDATVIKKLREAKLSPFGRTNMDEFAMGGTTESSFYGKTLNPIDKSRVPGGSSGGSAAAVGGGLAIVALGSDTGGSIRQPAAFCGCVGFKPSYGRVSRYGLGAYSSSLDQIGPITQNVEDAAILYDIISGYDEKDSTSYNGEYQTTADKLNKNRKFTIAVIQNYIDQADSEIRDRLLEVIEKLKKDGHKIIYKNFSNANYDIATYCIISTAEASANLSRFDGIRYGRRAEANSLGELYSKTRGEGFGSEVKRRILLGTFVLSSGYYDAYYVKAQKAREFISKEYEEIFKEADIVFMPVTPTTAYKLGANKTPMETFLGDLYTVGVNLAGIPAISVPVGKDKDGLNISAQIVGKKYDEQSVLDGGLILEKIVKE